MSSIRPFELFRRLLERDVCSIICFSPTKDELIGEFLAADRRQQLIAAHCPAHRSHYGEMPKTSGPVACQVISLFMMK